MQMFIRLSDLMYPLTMEYILNQDPTIPRHTPPEEMDDFGYALVRETSVPPGCSATEVDPLFLDGMWRQQWKIVPLVPEEDPLTTAKKARNKEINELREKTLELGMKYNFPDGTTEHVQLRPLDVTLIIGRRMVVDNAMREGKSFMVELRTYEDNSKYLTMEQFVHLSDAVSMFVDRIYPRSWELKAMVDNAPSIELIPELPLSLLEP